MYDPPEALRLAEPHPDRSALPVRSPACAWITKWATEAAICLMDGRGWRNAMRWVTPLRPSWPGRRSTAWLLLTKWATEAEIEAEVKQEVEICEAAIEDWGRNWGQGQAASCGYLPPQDGRGWRYAILPSAPLSPAAGRKRCFTRMPRSTARLLLTKWAVSHWGRGQRWRKQRASSASEAIFLKEIHCLPVRQKMLNVRARPGEEPWRLGSLWAASLGPKKMLRRSTAWLLFCGSACGSWEILGGFNIIGSRNFVIV